MNQEFSVTQLRKLCKESEIEAFGYNDDDFEIALSETYSKILNGQFDFSFQIYKHFFLVNDLCQKLVLRKLNDNVKRIYKDEQANRRIIINQVKTLLEDTTPSLIIKTDIKSFYESINRNRIIEKVQDDALLSYHSIKLIKKIFDHPLIKEKTGLPRGVNLSATLSEIYLRKFDNWIRSKKGIFYYARFVDDMIIFTHSINAINNLQNEISEKLGELAEGLILNREKTQTFKSININNKRPLEYLGYKFIKENQKKHDSLKITIADKKVKKVKTRIIKALLDYSENLDFNLLVNRIKFLTGNYSIRKRTDGTDLRAGLYYNYMEVTDLSVFDELNKFYLKAINSKNGAFGRKISSSLSKQQIITLSKFSFKFGFLKKVYYSLSYDQTKNIISCWQCLK